MVKTSMGVDSPMRVISSKPTPGAPRIVAGKQKSHLGQGQTYAETIPQSNDGQGTQDKNGMKIILVEAKHSRCQSLGFHFYFTIMSRERHENAAKGSGMSAISTVRQTLGIDWLSKRVDL